MGGCNPGPLAGSTATEPAWPGRPAVGVGPAHMGGGRAGRGRRTVGSRIPLMTKQLLVMVALTLLGTVGVFVLDPFYGVAIYYLYAVLRPQYIWEWSLPTNVTWSFYVAICAIVAAVGVKC